MTQLNSKNAIENLYNPGIAPPLLQLKLHSITNRNMGELLAYGVCKYFVCFILKI